MTRAICLEAPRVGYEPTELGGALPVRAWDLMNWRWDTGEGSAGPAAGTTGAERYTERETP